jgi:hypothetical protein
VLLADRFVYIHEPKTGGTFVSYALSQLHGGLIDVRPSRFVVEAIRLRLPAAAFSFERRARSASPTSAGSKYGPLYNWNDHGTCNEIPKAFRAGPIFATVRNPFQKYVSGYLFGWWKRSEYLPLYNRTIPDFAQRYSNFPELSFREYMELMHATWTVPGNRGLYSGRGIGFQSERFIRFYFRVPWLRRGTTHDISSIVRRLDSEYIESGQYVADLFDIRFLRTERLNQELSRTLLELGYEPADVEFVESLKHIVPVGGTEIGFTERATSHDWASFYTHDLTEVVRQKDRLLFLLFPDFDVPAEPGAA